MTDRKRRARALAAVLAATLSATLLAACSPAPGPTGWSGYAEAQYTYVSAPVPGTLRTLDVARGQQVAAGASLFELDSEAERAAVGEAEARFDASVAQAADAGKGKRPDEREVVRAQLAQAREQAALARSELARYRGLMRDGFVSKTRLDALRTGAAQADAHVRELEAAIRVANLPARDDARAAAAAQVEAASQALRQARWRLAQRRVDAPVAGTVVDTYLRVGETAPAGQPVLALLPPGEVKARFFVPETEIASIALGQPVRVHCDGCGGPIDARVDFIATRAEYTPPVIYSNSQRARLVFMVEARPAPGDAARLRPGVPVDVERATGAGR